MKVSNSVHFSDEFFLSIFYLDYISGADPSEMSFQRVVSDIRDLTRASSGAPVGGALCNNK